jgi:hypothetical protein
MQFQGSPSSNIVIRGNVFLPQNVTDVQGIFMSGKGGHTNITIEQNIIYTGMANGIVVDDGVNVKIYNNTVINAVGDSGGVSWIDASGADIKGNITTAKKGGDDGSNINIQHLDSKAGYYLTDLFKNFDGKNGITLEDFRPEKGSLAKAYGAHDRLMELLDGTSSDTGGGRSVSDEIYPAKAIAEEAPTLLFGLMGDAEFSRADNKLVKIEHASGLKLDEGTIAFSFDANKTNTKGGLISNEIHFEDGDKSHIDIWVKNGKLVARFKDDDSIEKIKLKGIEKDHGYDVQVVFHNDKVKLYVDGERAGSKNFAFEESPNDVNLQIGGLGQTHNSGEHLATKSFDGIISDVAVFEHAFTPQDYDFFA